MWGMETPTVPVVTGALGAIKKRIKKHTNKIPGNNNVTGSQVGVVVITRASHLYDPGSTPGVRMWADICPSLSDSESFSPGTPVFLPP